MSWVISKYLYKSGGNAIHNRIGNYNNHSSKRCQILGEIYKKTADFVKNKKLNETGINNIYNVTDKYIRSIVLSKGILSREKGSVSTFIRSYSSRVPYYIAMDNYYKTWRLKYTKNIVDKIWDNVEWSSLRVVLKSIPPKDVFIPMALAIFATNKKYSSLQEILKLKYQRSLMEEVMNACRQRVNKERTGILL